ncbi:MAG: hypothetical protein ACJ8F7_23055 [Gemmataceae bacterium]
MRKIRDGGQSGGSHALSGARPGHYGFALPAMMSAPFESSFGRTHRLQFLKPTFERNGDFKGGRG